MTLIELEGIGREALGELLDEAESFLDERGRPRVPLEARDRLKGRSIALLFFEPSTRTRSSFELAARRLGAIVVGLEQEGSSLEKGESILDTCLNLEAMGVDAFVVRHRERDLPYVLSERLEAPIINAGNGAGEHPTQGLLDALTLRRALGDAEGTLQGRRVTILGDIIRSRVARSDVHALEGLGAQVTLAGPAPMVPQPGEAGWGGARVVTSSRAEALEGADAIIALRIQRERMHDAHLDLDEYSARWGIDAEVAAAELEPEARILHPGPVIRGVELTGEVADGPRSLILQQVRCGVAVRAAVLGRLAAAESSEDTHRSRR